MSNIHYHPSAFDHDMSLDRDFENWRRTQQLHVVDSGAPPPAPPPSRAGRTITLAGEPYSRAPSSLSEIPPSYTMKIKMQHFPSHALRTGYSSSPARTVNIQDVSTFASADDIAVVREHISTMQVGSSIIKRKSKQKKSSPPKGSWSVADSSVRRKVRVRDAPDLMVKNTKHADVPSEKVNTPPLPREMDHLVNELVTEPVTSANFPSLPLQPRISSAKTSQKRRSRLDLLALESSGEQSISVDLTFTTLPVRSSFDDVPLLIRSISPNVLDTPVAFNDSPSTSPSASQKRTHSNSSSPYRMSFPPLYKADPDPPPHLLARKSSVKLMPLEGIEPSHVPRDRSPPRKLSVVKGWTHAHQSSPDTPPRSPSPSTLQHTMLLNAGLLRKVRSSSDIGAIAELHYKNPIPHKSPSERRSSLPMDKCEVKVHRLELDDSITVPFGRSVLSDMPAGSAKIADPATAARKRENAFKSSPEARLLRRMSPVRKRDQAEVDIPEPLEKNTKDLKARLSSPVVLKTMHVFDRPYL